MKENVMKRLMVWFLLAVLFLPAVPSWAADGDIDTTFGTDGRVTTDFGTNDDNANAVAIQSDGKIVAAGAAGEAAAGDDQDFALARYNTDGTLDTTFGTGGKVTTDFTDIRGTITTWGRSDDDGANGVAIQSDGKIVAAGTAGNTDFALARYNTDGTLDTTFGTGGRVTTYSSANTPISSAIASAVAIQTDGKIVAAGYAYNSDQHIDANQYDFVLARFNTDGTLDTTFGAGGIVVTAFGEGTDYDYANAVAIQTDGKIIAAGATGPRSNYGGTNDKFALVRYNTDGTLDTSFGAGGKVTTTIGLYSDAYAIAIQSDGKIVATGYAYKGDYYADFALARYNTDGTLDTTFGTDGAVTTAISANSNVDNARAVAIQTDGKIVAAGIDSSYYFALVRYNTDGTLDTTFGTGGMATTTNYDKAYAVAIQSDGNIVAAGLSNDGDFVVVRYLTGAATSTPTPLPTPPPQGGAGIIFGFINDADGNALQGVTVSLDGADSSEHVTTDEEGYFEFRNLSAGDYTLTCEKDGYETYTQGISLGNDEIQEIETIVLEEIVKATISGYVVDINGNPVENVRIKAKGVKTGYKITVTSDTDGFFEFTDLDADTYVIIAKKNGYKKARQTIKLGDGESEEVVITLKKTGKKIIKASAL